MDAYINGCIHAHALTDDTHPPPNTNTEDGKSGRHNQGSPVHLFFLSLFLFFYFFSICGFTDTEVGKSGRRTQGSDAEYRPRG